MDQNLNRFEGEANTDLESYFSTQFTADELLLLSSHKRMRFIQPPGFIDLEIPPDGYGWLKYGQKNLAKIQKRRHYYKCAMQKGKKCQAKRYVDFVPEDPRNLKVIYSGVHNHPPDQLERKETYTKSLGIDFEDVEEIFSRDPDSGIKNVGRSVTLSSISGDVAFHATAARIEAEGNKGSDRTQNVNTTHNSGGGKVVDKSGEYEQVVKNVEGSLAIEMATDDMERPENVFRRGSTFVKDAPLESFLYDFSPPLENQDLISPRLSAQEETLACNSDREVDTLERSKSLPLKYQDRNGENNRCYDLDLFLSRSSQTERELPFSTYSHDNHSLAPLPANRPPSSEISTPIGKFYVYPRSK